MIGDMGDGMQLSVHVAAEEGLRDLICWFGLRIASGCDGEKEEEEMR